MGPGLATPLALLGWCTLHVDIESERLRSLYHDSTPTFLYFDLYLNTAYAAHYVYFTIFGLVWP